MPAEVHPVAWQPRLARALRSLRNVPGWRRTVAAMMNGRHVGDFVVVNKTGVFAGALSSYIDRQIYLFGGYENEEISEFLAHVGAHGDAAAILDIGANVGTHSVAFARHFGSVHSFEPNADLWTSFERNVGLNALRNVSLHRFGLSDREGTVPFYLIAKDNRGLGTAVAAEQYDLPLDQIGEISLRRGDDVVRELGIKVSAIKIDVQGLEQEVLRGLSETIREHRPIIWVEMSAGTEQIRTIADVERLLGYPVSLYRFEIERSLRGNDIKLRPFEGARILEGDYVIQPRERANP